MILALFRPVWNYRSFVKGSIKREFQQRYVNSILGASWVLIQPTVMIFVYTVIFSQMMKAKLPGIEGGLAYSIYLCAGILTWGLFTEITTRAQNIFLENANLLKKVSFPRLCLPSIVVLNALINFSVIFSVFLVFLVLTGNFPGLVFFAVIPVLSIQILFSIGLGVLLGVLNVFFRDVGQAFNVILQLWFWFTPIVYPKQILPENVQSLLIFNPMATIIEGYQSIFVYATAPKLQPLLAVAALAVLTCLIALRLFRKKSGEMVDEL
jgi:lipopolysaccharide transport system permease protein